MSNIAGMYRYIVGIGVPLALAAIGVLGKKVVRGKGWRQADFFLGIELCLAGIANGLVSSCELLKVAAGTLPIGSATYAILSAGVTFAGFFIFIFLLSIHQDWESKDGDQRGKFWRLGIISNVLGLGILIGSTFSIPGLG